MSKLIEQTSDGISRREWLIGAGALAALSSGLTQAAGHAHGEHIGGDSEHRHEDHTPKHEDLLGAVNNCIDKGQRCVSHCFAAYKAGDLTLADCGAKANEMLAVCRGFSALVTSNSNHIMDYSKICRALCTECEEECKKHEDKHMECKACAEACATVISAIDKALA